MSHPSPGPIPFTSQGVYRCPVCRYGELSQMVMMEAFSCNFCDRIFTANFDRHQLQLADNAQPRSWYWNGRGWQGVQQQGSEFGWGLILLAIAFCLLPPTIVWLGAHLFPPLPGSRLAWLPDVWVGLTLAVHGAIVAGFAIEYYQFPVWLFLRAWWRSVLPPR
jgi:hypothetical protein